MDIETLRRDHPEHWMRACAIRALTLDAVAEANSGHSGMPMGMADVATVLHARHLKFAAAHPLWPDRDRFVLSNGHGSMLLYALMHLTGYPSMTLDEIRNFRQWGAATPGHPEYNHAPGIETTTGPLGQGLATAVGFAMAEEMLRARWGEALVDHRTWVVVGDGCLMEGVSHEAIALAGMQRLTQAHRALRRQRHHHRRPREPRRPHRPGDALPRPAAGPPSSATATTPTTSTARWARRARPTRRR